MRLDIIGSWTIMLVVSLTGTAACSPPPATNAVNAPMVATTAACPEAPAATSANPLPFEVAPSPLPPQPPLPPAATPAPTPLATTIELFYQNARPFECDLTNEHFTKNHNTQSHATMHLVFARPGELRIDLATGEAVVIGSQVLTMLDAKKNITVRSPVAQDFCPLALSFTGNQGTLNSHLAFQLFPGAQLNLPGTTVLVGSALTPTPTMTKALYFATPNGEVVRTLLVSSTGDRDRFDFVRCKYNVTPPPAASLFARPIPPPGPTLSPNAPPVKALTTGLP